MRTAVVIFSLLAILGGFLAWWRWLQTYHYQTVADQILYRDGNRNLREFQTALRKSNTKTVVMLIDDNELHDPAKPQFAQEEQYLRDKHINLIRIPIPLGGWPTSDQIQQFLSITEDKSNWPILVHCAQGVRRTGMLVAAYQQSIQNLSPADATSQIQTFGHSDRTSNDIKRFIQIYDPQKRQVTTTLAPSNE